MSRFFRSASDSESETDTSDNESFISDEELSSEEESDFEEEQDDQPQKSRFLKGAESDSDEESDEEFGRKRQVKSQKDKRLEEMQNSIKAIENGQKNKDWTLIANEYEKLSSYVAKATQGFNEIAVPKGYIKVTVELQDLLQETLQKEKSAKKKMSAGNNKAMNSMRQKLRKVSKEYDQLIQSYNKDPEQFMEEPEEEEEAPAPRAASPSVAHATATASVAAEDLDSFTSVGRGGRTVVEPTRKEFFVRLKEVLEARGKKNTNREEQTAILEELLELATSPFQKITVLLALISSRFDINLGNVAYMPLKAWKAAEKELNQLLQILETNKQFVIREDVEEYEYNDKDVKPAEGEIIKIRGSIISFVERLDDEFTKSLQNIDPHTTDYIDRLRDEPSLYAILVRAQAYAEMYNMEDAVARVVIRRLEHLYFKPEQVIRSTERIAKELLPKYISSKIITTEEPSQLIHQLCAYLYNQPTSIFRTRAMLCHIYHFALHKKFHTARDMLLMSHLQETIHQADIATQILYNRAMVQIGLCAFREGLVKEAHASLQEIQGSGRVKELLAQGVQASRYGQQSTPESDQLEKQRQLPFHMHINLELLECVFLTCSMLLEIPAQAQAGPNNKKFISRPFRRLLDYNERQAFTGPPENTRDHIMSAAKALASGEWERAKDYILAIKIWDLMTETQQIKDMLVRKIQEEGLRTYLFTYASYYSTLGLSQLSTMFDLPVSRVSAIIAKIIWNEELAASLDQVSQCVVLHQVEPSRLQVLAVQFAEKAANLVDQNERLSTAGRDTVKVHN
ncbi:eukaryotic translation initiation factor 3 subunit 8 N-terminus-domain-containing protein [Radiomyces spectabilis]|uniref:eukaryotic translation initiation factor 3 subunit 8 N-terminus-domain-containing protein n=1 Tax=Radiomyces spectabilis TaxID=64574 RepID=UPI00221FD09D|nr:eukaryotic translation initiation factor 3 subunit 8 N-terminus-domain-containing protein [Radiomyces spectabilis]KAI8374254.1 eukaryotic translation initiation factor 3 subunit 8 N-terminus-domain-containing protein [Radiomyces spectabilis]